MARWRTCRSCKERRQARLRRMKIWMTTHFGSSTDDVRSMSRPEIIMERKLTPSFESMQVKEVVEANTVVHQSLSRTTLAVDGPLFKHFSIVVTSQGEPARIVALWRPCGRCGDGANRITTSQERRDACFHHIITSEEASDDTTSKITASTGAVGSQGTGMPKRTSHHIARENGFYEHPTITSQMRCHASTITSS